jgi:hypothetical protein
MAALNIPGIGEALGRNYMRVMTFGATGESPDVSIASTTTGAVVLANVNEADVFVHDIEKQVVIAFDGATSLEFTVGDGDDVDGYWTDTLFVPTTSDAVFGNMATTVGYAQGKMYTSSDTIDLGITGGLTAGKAKLRFTYSRGVDTDLAPATGS